LSGVLFRIDSA